MATTQELLNLDYRTKILTAINSGENILRKRRSFGDYQVYNDHTFKYVYEKLERQLGKSTACQMPVVSNLNVTKRMVTERATIYNTPPERTYENTSEADTKAIEAVYDDGGFDTMFGKANKYYCLRQQAFLQVVPRDKKMWLKVIQAHNVDVIPRDDDPEKAFAYIISSFDKSGLITSDGVNQVIADPDDAKKEFRRYQVWCDEIVFTMDGNGKIVSDILPNELQRLPFIDIAKDKDLTFFTEFGQALTDFTVDFNVAWSDLMYTMRLQNFSIGVVSGDPALKPVEMVVGANKWLFMPSNPNNINSKVTFDFVSPSPQIEASLKAIESLITTFLTTQGLDTKAVQVTSTGANKFSSALERLLAMIDQYIATKDDFDLFKCVEHEVHEITVKYLDLLTGTELLDTDYWVTAGIVNSELSLRFHEPQMIETESEKITNGGLEIAAGVSDRVQLYAKLRMVSLEQAEKEIMEIEQRKIRMNIAIQKLRTDAGLPAVEPVVTTQAGGAGPAALTKGPNNPNTNSTSSGDPTTVTGGDLVNNQNQAK